MHVRPRVGQWQKNETFLSVQVATYLRPSHICYLLEVILPAVVIILLANLFQSISTHSNLQDQREKTLESILWALESNIELDPLWKRENPCPWCESFTILSSLPLSSFSYLWEGIFSFTFFTYWVLIVVGAGNHWRAFSQIQEHLVAWGWPLNACTPKTSWRNGIA